MKRLLQFFTIALAIGAMVQSVVLANGDKEKNGKPKETTKETKPKEGGKPGGSTQKDPEPGI